MTWSKDNTISLLALLATCVPVVVLIVTCLLRQRRQRAKKQGEYLIKEIAMAAMLNKDSSFRRGGRTYPPRPAAFALWNASKGLHADGTGHRSEGCACCASRVLR